MQLGSRAWFPTLADVAYLNHAAISPPSTPVREAVAACLDHYATVGAAAFPASMALRQRLKTKLAHLLGCDATDLALTTATSHGLVAIAHSLRLQPGERILTFDGEFPANVTPWQQAARAAGAEVVLLDQPQLDDEALLATLARALAERPTRLVTTSVVQFSTGRAMPVAAITALAHAHGALVCVDAIQALGVMPFDARATGVDFLAGGAHKWLMGVEGVGFVYARDTALDQLDHGFASWLSHEEPIRFLVEGAGHLRYDRPVRRSIDHLEGHSQSAIGFAALDAALDPLLSLGIDAIQAHVRAYNDALEAGLRARGFTSLRRPGSPSGTLAALPPLGRDTLAIARSLAQQGVAVSTPDGKLRFSPHWPNALAEVPGVLDAVDVALH